MGLMGHDFSQDVQDYNRATELERVGGILLEEGLENASRCKLTILRKAA